MRLIAVVWALAFALSAPVSAQTVSGLANFTSEAEARAFLAEHGGQEVGDPCPSDWEVCPGYEPGEYVVITGSRISAPPITNNQEAGVDEGDIVKLWGDTLVILRRGRLFTVDIAQGGLRPVDSIAAYAPGVDAADDWYDEILVADGWVVVVGYSYERETTEINRFRIDERGHLSFVDSHRLAAQDYYSSRNYTARLVGERLVIYSPVSVEGANPLAHLPRLSRLRARRGDLEMTLFQPERIYRTPSVIENAQPAVETIHGVIECDLTARAFACSGTALVGPARRRLYVSRDAAYLWLGQAEWDEDDNLTAAGSILYRLGFDGSGPEMVRTLGFPGDQLSFAEDREAGLLNVLVLLEGPEITALGGAGGNAVGLLRLPLSRFGARAEPPDLMDYRLLTSIPENASDFRNQMLETHAVYAVSTYGYSGASLVSAAPIETGEVISWLVEGRVERVERVGHDALVVARTAGGVEFLTLDLLPDDDDDRQWHTVPDIRGTYLLEASRGAETRSHAFFYQPDPSSPDGEFGVLGLPVIREFERDSPLFDQAADVIFIRRGHDQLRPLGTLNSQPEQQADDACLSSCVDWYGDARPIFIGDRIFALLGYELVEGRPEGRAIREIQRATFAPRASAQ